MKRINQTTKTKMKAKQQLFTIVLMLSLTPIYSQFDSELVKRNWKVGKEKVVYGHGTLRLEGKNDEYTVTNVGMQTLSQLILDLDKKAAAEMWKESDKNDRIKGYEQIAKGGIIWLYLGRVTIDTANLENFTVIIIDADNKIEIHRKEFESDIPSVPSSSKLGLWTNAGFVNIPMDVTGDVNVHVIDRLGISTKKYSFKITL
jgi:hypothetical protein